MHVINNFLYGGDATSPSPHLPDAPFTSFSCCKLSRRISVWPGNSVTVDIEPRVAVPPLELTRIVLLIASSEARFAAG